MEHSEELVQSQLSALMLLQAMFPVDGELELLDDTAELVQQLSEPCERFDPSKHRALRLVINFLLENEPTYPFQLDISLPLAFSSGSPQSPPTPLLTFRQPIFLSRASHDEIQASLLALPTDGESSELVLAAVEHLRTLIPAYLPKEATAPSVVEAEFEELERVWFWFPSLSTREKRKDLVDYAPNYSLTGFVLAGKPGLLCLEGTSKNVDDYMSAIKSSSWSDIPSYQKKVTERHRDPITHRLFPDMQEITSQISQRGQWNNRGEMGEIRRWMEDKGVGGVFARVVGGGGGLGKGDEE